MTKEKIKKFMIYGVYGDILKYKNDILTTEKEPWKSYNKWQWSYITELLILTLKSLIPSTKSVKTQIDYNRFREELNLWYYYRHGYNEILLKSAKGKLHKRNYWIDEDDSVYSRIFLITASNKEFSEVKDEVIKNILYTTGNIENLLEGIVLSKLLHLLINENNRNIKDLLKEEIIHLSQKDIVEKYRKHFRFDIKTYPNNYTIVFEKLRISILNLLNGIKEKRFKRLKISLDILQGNIIYFDNIEYDFFLYGLMSLFMPRTKKIDYDNIKLIENLAIYLSKLRNGRIPPENLYIKDYHLPDIFKFNEGEFFFHSLLNKCKVIKKEKTNTYIKSLISSKTGMYRFIKIK
ncbi:hypothetical protein [Thermohalobacter berrensis]|uniref:Uncharacterized protein n=1 Tax=Thermohalobacter berrensis TaxID=99594 RepID=A0A419T542_9FIRM|nr:hypothetical protein [Thermohalobacter berrensis]RKD32566.1 hypothetical protein BET03_10850 [Thermohalobacter berrensis]